METFLHTLSSGHFHLAWQASFEHCRLLEAFPEHIQIQALLLLHLDANTALFLLFQMPAFPSSHSLLPHLLLREVWNQEWDESLRQHKREILFL